MNVHNFGSTRDAYHASQCDSKIKTGDLLVVDSEGVIGVVDTWPIAVTAEHGALHCFESEGFDRWLASFSSYKRPLMEAGIKAAVDLAKLKEYPLHALFN